MIILGIETSCDETAAAVVSGCDEKVEILSNVVSSQIEIHKKYGGVVPEVAAREHILNILPVVHESLKIADLKYKKNYSSCHSREGGNPGLATRSWIPAFAGMTKEIDAIAVTVGPGLITSLITGIETAKTLAYAWNIPIVAVNHIEGHIYANFIKTHNMQRVTCNTGVNFPAIILTVSGGHTMLVLMEKHGKFKTIGETRDDAAGEAFDKAAKMLEIGYPGGPAISAFAEKYSISNIQHSLNNRCSNAKTKKSIDLPRPMIDGDNFDFSFSGLKTALRYALEKDKDWQKRIPEYCFEFQQAVIDVLIHKTIKATKKYKAKTIMLAGGVSANTELRKQFTEKTSLLTPNIILQIPDLKYTTDNAAMVASAGYFKAKRKEFTPWQKLRVDCNLTL